MAIGTTAALLIGGGLLGSAALSSNAASSAGRTVANATDQAAQLQNQQFQQLLQLQMPAYQRGEQAAGIYSRALGIPSMTGQPQPQSYQPSYQTGQPGASVSYGGMMTGGGYTGNRNVDGYSYQQDAPYDYSQPQSAGADPNAPQINGGPGDGTQPTGGLMTGGQTDQQMIYDQVRNTPGYQNQLDQGLKSIDRAAPLVGGMYSGRRMKALNDYGQQTFGSYYNDWMNRLGGVAGQGTQTAQQIGAAGQANAANQGNLMVQGANARAQGQMSSANAWSGAIGTGIGLYGGSQGWFGR